MISTNSDWENLHDARLQAVTINWPDATVEFLLYPSSNVPKRLILKGLGLLCLSVPRKNEWGESVSINLIETTIEGRDTKLKIEMQSGDVIEAVVQQFELLWSEPE